MSDTTPPGNRNEFPISLDQILHLLQDSSDNIRHAKAQQWRAGYFTVLAYGALIYAAYTVNACGKAVLGAQLCVLATIESVLTAAAGVAGIWMVWGLQCWMKRLRQSMTAAECHLSCEYREIVGSNNGDKGNSETHYKIRCWMPNYHSVFYRSHQAWLITFALVAGCLIALCIIVLKVVTG